MKQMDECLNRAFEGKLPLESKKWKAVIRHEVIGHVLYLFHYHHQVLVYVIERNQVAESWWEKPTDKRGLDAALKFLEENKDRLPAFLK